MDADTGRIVDDVIRGRRTTRVLADEPFPVDDLREVVEELAATAGWAPFHRVAARVHQESGALTSIVPWRFYLVDAAACRTLRQALLERGDKGKIPRMLATARALVLATWLPNPPRGPITGLFEATEENMEHVAAAGAAVQNLLLAATARGIPSYWSSAGPLRGPEAFGWMGIPAGEILLGGIFLFPTDPAGAEVNPGSHRDRRGEPSDWTRWVEVDLERDGPAGGGEGG
jgi:nitroreductase